MEPNRRGLELFTTTWQIISVVRCETANRAAYTNHRKKTCLKTAPSIRFRFFWQLVGSRYTVDLYYTVVWGHTCMRSACGLGSGCLRRRRRRRHRRRRRRRVALVSAWAMCSWPPATRPLTRRPSPSVGGRQRRRMSNVVSVNHRERPYRPPMRPEETRGDPRRPEETRGDPRRTEETRGDPRRPEETRGDPRRPEETRGDPRRTEETRGDPRRPEETRGDPRRPEETRGDPRKPDKPFHTHSDPICFN